MIRGLERFDEQGRLKLRFFLEFGGLILERFGPAFWRIFAWFAVFVTLSLFDVWQLFPYWVHSASLLIFATGVYLLLRRGLKNVRPPTADDVARRLESRANLRHRPLDKAGGERMADPTATMRQQKLWRAEMARAQNLARRAKAGWPKLGLPRFDPNAIRLALLLFFLISAVDAGSDFDTRLERGFRFQFSEAPSAVILDFWITPPAYTGHSPITLMSAADGPLTQFSAHEPLRVPKGSIAQLRVSGTERVPRFSLGSGDIRMDRVDESSFALSTKLDAGEEARVTVGYSIEGRWPIEIVEDRPPQIAFSTTPRPTARQALQVSYDLSDDYGVERAELELTRVGFSEGEPEVIALSGAATAGGTIRQTSYTDLTAHEWAGFTVNAVLRAWDGIGQESRSEEIQFVLPEREFTHPVARNLASIRKSLFVSPDKRETAGRRLELQAKRYDEYDRDFVVFSALRSAYWRLKENEGDDLHPITDLLWSTALRLEDGMMSLADNELRDAFDRLSEQLKNGDSPQSFDEFADELMKAMESFLSARQQRNGQQTGEMPENAKIIDRDTLERMVQQMKDLAASGRTQEALEILRELREIMENLRPAPMTAEDMERLRNGAESLNELRQLQDKQQDLMERTTREGILNSLRERLGDQDSGELGELSDQQKGLGEELRELMDQLGANGFDMPEDLPGAEKSMGQAGSSLDNRDTENALENQGEALEALKRASEELRQALSQALEQMQSSGGVGQDPLGRAEGSRNGGEVEIPSEREMNEARRILQQLRDRLSEPDRTDVEIEYIRRLLRRF